MPTSFRRITRAEALDQGFTDRQLQHLVRSGVLHRVRPGEFALPDEWKPATALDRHRELVLRTAERVSAPQVYSHFAAAALWGIRIRGRWPDRVDVLTVKSSGGRSSGRLRRHAVGFDDCVIVDLDGLQLTSPAQTVVDLARMLPFVDAVVASDSALGTAFGRERLTTHAELRERVDAGPARGARRVRAVLAEADGRSESPPESESRVSAVLLGFPRPDLQREFRTAIGDFATDLWWPDDGVAGECDGDAKYTDLAYLGTRTPQQVFRDEKARERALRAHPDVNGLVRWAPSDLQPLTRFYDILVGAGLGSTFGRPTAASWGQAQVDLIAIAARGPFARHS